MTNAQQFATIPEKSLANTKDFVLKADRRHDQLKLCQGEFVNVVLEFCHEAALLAVFELETHESTPFVS